MRLPCKKYDLHWTPNFAPIGAFRKESLIKKFAN